MRQESRVWQSTSERAATLHPGISGKTGEQGDHDQATLRCYDLGSGDSVWNAKQCGKARRHSHVFIYGTAERIRGFNQGASLYGR